MSEKMPSMPTPEEIAGFNKSRRLSDAELIKKGAEVTPDDKIIATEAQVERAKYDYLTDMDFDKLKEREAFADEIGLTAELRKLYIDKKLMCFDNTDNTGSIIFYPEEGVTEEHIIEFIKALPRLGTYDVCGAKIISEDVIKAVLEKNPKAEFSDLPQLGSESGYWEEKITEMRGKIG